jgi:hypothetical protein
MEETEPYFDSDVNVNRPKWSLLGIAFKVTVELGRLEIAKLSL